MFVLIDKPKGVTSHDVVDHVRAVTGERKVGHAGTLDPMATGLLILGVSREFTKKLGEITKKTRKTYVAEIFLGEERDTDDVEGKVIRQSKGINPPPETKVKLVLDSFQGKQEQLPPIYSAIKMGGKKAYELARKGKNPELKKRKINIYDIEFLKYSFPLLKIRVQVSAGTYIRALARDIGNKLKTHGYLYNLRRTDIGNISVTEAVKLDEFNKNYWEASQDNKGIMERLEKVK